MFGIIRVQNFELFLMLENCINNNRFIKNHPKRLKIVNPIADLKAPTADLIRILFLVCKILTI
jgi:hypothetical protein